MLTQYRFNSIYTALGDIYTANLLIKIYSIAPLLCVFPALFFIKEGHALAVIYFAAIWLAFILGSRYLGMKAKEEDLIGQCQSNFRNTPEHTKLIWFGFHQSVNSLLNTASAHLDKIIIFQLLGAQQTAIYFIAISMPNRFRGILKQFDGYIFARFAKHSLEAVQNKLLKRFLIAMLLVIPIYIVYMVTAPWFFNILLPEYTEAAHLSQIYAITLFAGAVIIPQSVLKAHSNSRIFYLLTICFSIIRISFVFIGVTIYGTTGAIYGVTIAALLYLIANLLAASTFKINPAKNLDF